MATTEEFVRWWGTASYGDRLNWMNSIHNGQIPPAVLEELRVDEVKRQFGYLSVYLDHPEIGPILRQAADGGWTQDRLQAALFSTNFWKTTSAAQREWQLLRSSDPAEATKRVSDMQVQLRNLVDQQGFGDRFTDANLSQLAEVFLSQNMPQEQIQRALFAQLPYLQGRTPQGTAGLTMAQVKRRAQDFGLPMSDEAAYSWSTRIASGQATQDAVEVYLRDQAKSRYSWLAADIDRGATIRELFDPMLQQTAQLLEMDPSKIDLTNNKFSGLIDFVDDNGTRRSMTLSEAGQAVRSMSEWQTTDNAKQAASQAADSILKSFGKVA